MRSFQRSRSKGNVLPPSVRQGARGKVLNVALQLFARQGFHGTSTRDLTTALEMQPSALYAHFPSKEHVLAELVREGYSLHHQTLRGALLEAGAKPKEQLSALVKANARFHAENPMLAVVVHEEFHCLPSELSEAAVVLRDQSVALLRQVVERGVAQGVFRPPDLMTALAAVGAMAVRIPYWFTPKPDFDIEALANAQSELALRMMAS